MKKRILLCVSLIAIVSMAVCATGNQENRSAGGSSTTEVSHITWNSGYQFEVDLALAEKFMDANPGIKIELQSVAQGFDDKVLTAHAAGNTPDGLMMWNTPQFVEAGIVEELSSFIDRDGVDMDQYHPVTKSWAEYNGGVWGLPKDYTPRAIYYNKDVFDEAGVPYPKDGWTFDEFLEISKKITNGESGADARYGYVAIPGHTYAMQQFIWSNGGDLCSPDGKTASGYIDSPEVVEVVEWYKKLFDMSITTSTMDAYQNLGQTEFQTGIVGMMDNGSWPVSVFKDDASLRFGIVAPPVPRKGMQASPVIHSATYSMFAKAKQKDAIWEYLKFVAGPEGNRHIEGEKFGIGAIPGITETTGLLNDPYLGEFFRIGADATMVPVFTRNARWFEADGEFQAALEAIFLTDADIQETLTKAAKKMDRILQGN